jgi:hypothetical protein
MRYSIFVLGIAMAVSGAAIAGQPQAAIEGNYIEARSCDVYTAACNANSEIGLAGEEATMAWQVTRGSHKGVDVTGLSVVAVIRTDSTLTDTSLHAFRGRGVVIVDRKANAAQRDALVDFAKAQSGTLLSDVIKIETAPILMTTGADEPHGSASLQVGDLVNIQTRSLHESDKHCGNDRAYYPPLTRVDEPVAAYTQRDMFSGDGLGVTWDEADRRSAYIARFEK